MNRSFLFVPGDSERKLSKAMDSAADALILDLEDSVDASKRVDAREQVREFLHQSIDAQRWVRISAINTDDAVKDLRAVMPAAPYGVVLPKPESADDVKQLAQLLDDLEHEFDVQAGTTRIMPIVTERPAALFTLHDYAQSTTRLEALSWGAEDLSAAVGASANRDDDGCWLPPYELARSLCLFAAAAASVRAVDTVFTNFRDDEGLQKSAQDARRDGFSGMLAIHPDQVPIINAAFSPTADELQRAQEIVTLFAQSEGQGVLQLNGEMIDRPHYLQAQRTLDAARKSDEDQ